MTAEALAAAMGRPVGFTVSASQYEKFALRCERWWAFDKIEGKKDPDGEKAKLGKRCHTIAEAYLRDGAAPNRAEHMVISVHGSPKPFYPGRIVSAMLHHLPPAGSVPRVEEAIDFRYRGIDFTGYIDWQDADTIGDHKFTSGLQYAKAASKLTTDPQGVIYRTARWLESDAKTATLQWTYGTFDAKESRKVVLPVVRGFDEIDSFIPTIERMARARADITEANSLEATGLRNFSQGKPACEMFGGCPNHPSRGGTCQVSGSQIHKAKIGAFMGSSVLERMKAKKAAAAAAGGAPAAAPETVAPERAAAVAADVAAIAKAQLLAGQINPPGEASEPLPKEAMEAPAPPAPALPADAPTAPEAAKRGRGRPKATQALPAGAPATVDAPTAPAAPASVANDTATAAPDGDGVRIEVLLVDCSAVKGLPAKYSALDASELITKAHKLVCEDQGVKHYKFMDYGAGPGALSVALGMLLDEMPTMYCVRVSTGSPEGRDVLQALIERSRSVFVGA